MWKFASKSSTAQLIEVSFALLQHHEERDLKILKVMKALGTLWLASNFEKEQLLDVAEFGNGEWDVAAEDMVRFDLFATLIIFR